MAVLIGKYVVSTRDFGGLLTKLQINLNVHVLWSWGWHKTQIHTCM